MKKEDKIIAEFIQNALYRLDESTRMIVKSLEELSDDELWRRPNNVSNSIANLILHLCGNIGQYAISSLGETTDIRNRDSEFSTDGGMNKTELLAALNKTVDKAKEIIESATIDRLLQKREVQGFHFSGIGIVIHVVEHYSYHTGQIAFWVKQLKNKDLGFYEGIDLNIKNE
ncbi:MAG: DinB family protein [Saonia sp.]